MSRIPALVLVVLAACASGPDPAAERALDSERVSPGLAEVDLAVARADVAALRRRLMAEVESAPADGVPSFLALMADLDRERAWGELKRAAAAPRATGWPHYGMGRIYMEWKTWDQARLSLEKAGALLPGEPLPRATLARALLELGRRPEAERLAAELASRHAGLPEVQVLRAELMVRAGDTQGAKSAYGEALRLEPRHLEAARAPAALCAGAGDEACEREALKTAGALGPADRALMERVALVYEAEGDLERAAAAMRGTEVLEKGDPRSLAHAARIFAAAGDAAGELAARETLDRLGPPDLDNRRRIVTLRRARGDGKGTEDALRALLELAPEDPEANEVRGRDALAAGNLREAAVALRLAVRGGAGEAVQAELAALEKRLHVRALDGRGSVGSVATAVMNVAGKLAAELRRKRPGLVGGEVVVKVAVGKDGRATAVELLQDRSGDPALAASVYLNLLDAKYPSQAGEFRLTIPIK